MIVSNTDYRNVNRANELYMKNNVKDSKDFTIETQNKLQAGTILSTIHLETGDSIGIYYEETSTDNVPMMLAKVKGKDGTVKEMKIDPKEVDPNNSSYVEMLALSAYLKQQGKIDGPAGTFATMVFNSRVKEANNNDIYGKQNFMPAMQELVDNALQNGQMDTYLRYLKELNLYSTWLMER